MSSISGVTDGRLVTAGGSRMTKDSASGHQPALRLLLGGSGTWCKGLGLLPAAPLPSSRGRRQLGVCGGRARLAAGFLSRENASELTGPRNLTGQTSEAKRPPPRQLFCSYWKLGCLPSRHPGDNDAMTSFCPVDWRPRADLESCVCELSGWQPEPAASFSEPLRGPQGTCARNGPAHTGVSPQSGH